MDGFGGGDLATSAGERDEPLEHLGRQFGGAVGILQDTLGGQLFAQRADRPLAA